MICKKNTITTGKMCVMYEYILKAHLEFPEGPTIQVVLYIVESYVKCY